MKIIIYPREYCRISNRQDHDTDIKVIDDFIPPIILNPVDWLCLLTLISSIIFNIMLTLGPVIRLEADKD